ncbi:CoA transferase, partial [Chloroflexota bacterium]
HYRCGNGKWIVLCMIQADRYWPAFCRVMGIQELEKDPRFESMEIRSQNAEALISILDNLFATKPRDEWMKIMETEDLIYGAVQTPTEAADDPQMLQNDYIVDWEHPTYGHGKVVGFPWKFSETPASLRRPVPELGEHTEETLLELGYGWDDITRLKEQKIIL